MSHRGWDAGAEGTGSTLDDALAMARHGIALREAGRWADAETVFLELTDFHPDRPFGWQELGVLYARTGRDDQALDVFRRAVEIEPHDLLPRTHCALHLLKLGFRSEADRMLTDHTRSAGHEAKSLQSLRAFLRYLHDWPEAKALASANRLEKGGSFLDVVEVQDRILSAVARRQPFSLIRLGDGEGAWMRLESGDEAAFSPLYAANRRSFLKIWFGGDTLHEAPAFHEAADTLMDVLAETDLIGIPYSLRVAHEYHIKSARGVPSINNILRWLDERLAPGRSTCSQDIHIELQRAGFFPRLFAQPCGFGLITCHRELGALVAASTGARIDHAHIIPEEKGSTEILGANGIAHAHFPFVYHEVLADLRSVPQGGRVWIVAAGILGKLYCAAIRDMGGVALDVGSLADGWLGKVTRPTLREIGRFVL